MNSISIGLLTLLLLVLAISLVYLLVKKIELFVGGPTKCLYEPKLQEIGDLIEFELFGHYNWVGWGEKYLIDLNKGGSKFNIHKKIPLCVDDESFTWEKRWINLCLKDENGDHYQPNMLVYVLLHELAHVINDGNSKNPELCDPNDWQESHGECWQKIFDELVQKAEAVNIYDSNAPFPTHYCGVDMT